MGEAAAGADVEGGVGVGDKGAGELVAGAC